MKPTLRAKIWIEVEGGVAFCHGKAAVLSAIRRKGSIRQAAKELKMSYRRAWSYVRELEVSLGEPILVTRVGGVEGGGARLTARARQLLDAYESAHQSVAAALDPAGGSVV